MPMFQRGWWLDQYDNKLAIKSKSLKKYAILYVKLKLKILYSQHFYV